MKKRLKSVQAHLMSAFATLTKNENLTLEAYKKEPENYSILKRLIKAQNKDASAASRLYRAIRMVAECPNDTHDIILNNFSASKAQLLQDIFCLVCTGGKKDGYFVEVGVGDGLSLSNSYMLENKYSWKGLLVEPCRSFHNNILLTRRAKLDKRAAGPKLNGKILFREVEGMGELSHAETANTGKRTKFTEAVEYEVETTTLNQILIDSNSPRLIDFLSVDTEGTELEILSGIDFTHFTFSVLAIEHNYRSGELQELDRLLVPKGYTRVLSGISKFDAWYIHASLQPLQYFA